MLKALLSWGRSHRRDFPWRGERDPYKLLVAEVMLQRSRSTTVAGVYQAFIEAWPDARSLEHASLMEIESTLFSLGLAKRADTLKRLAASYSAARLVEWDERKLQELPGVGPATAASVAASLGLGPLPVDAVSKRVYERALGKAGDELRSIVVTAMSMGNLPSDELNWAALDLAASTCLPKRPRCPECPLIRVCLQAGGSEPNGTP